MSRPLYEVLPDLKAPEGLETQLADCVVEKVVPSQDRSRVRIFLRSLHLIEKRDIYRLEAAIKQQYFAKRRLTVTIAERFTLSAQYTPENLLTMYRDSLLLETKHKSMLLYSLLRQTKLSFPEEGVVVCDLPNDAVSRETGPKLGAYLTQVLTERCGLAADVRLVYDREAGQKHLRELEESLRAEARAIRTAMMSEGAAADGAQSAPETAGEGARALASGTDASSPAPADLPWDGSPDRTAAMAAGREPSVSGRLPEGGEGPEAGRHPVSDDAAGNGQTARSGKKDAAGKTGENARKDRSARGADRGAGRSGKWNAARTGARRSNLPPSDDPDMLYGRTVEGDITPIHDLFEGSGEVTVTGRIFFVDERQLKSGHFLYIFYLTDEVDSISVKLFLSEEEAAVLRKELKVGKSVTVRGLIAVDKYDQEIALGSVRGIKRSTFTKQIRMDSFPDKRVELHCHTKMSEMDAVTDVEVLMERARAWGHRGLAITDHGIVQSFPLAFHKKQEWDAKWREKYAKEHPDATKEEIKKQRDPFQIIYGLEGYLVDDLKKTVVRPDGKDFSGDFVVFDIETTGFSAREDRIIEIGAVRVSGGVVKDRFSTFVNPRRPIPYRITELTSINDAMVLEAPVIDDVLPRFLAFCEGASLVAHNASFDVSFIRRAAADRNIPFAPTVVDTVSMARTLLPMLASYKLDAVAKAVGVPLGHHHRAVDDAECTAEIFLDLVRRCGEKGIEDLEQLNEAGQSTPETVRKLPTYHIILLIKNETGRVNLYRLVSESHLTYFGGHGNNKRPRIPRSLLQKYREGLVIGSACQAGELFQALLRGEDDETLAQTAQFYDYLEIQPIGNNRFMLASDDYAAQTDEDLRDLNRRIVALGDKLGKPVAATCDVHFCDPEDAIYRTIVLNGKGFKDAEDQAPLYMHTTEEMLREFDYLGPEKAREVVIDVPNRIADSLEYVEPVRPDKCPPVIENSDATLREICYQKAHEMYGDPLPAIVQERLEKELTSIIGNGYAVMYIIAQKLVWKSNEDGYLVGSRGSVGSSFVATMAGITEVNPLAPHYRCPSCHYVDFDSEDVKKFAGMAGCDMPDKVCPVCGKPLVKDGFDIPFETFLGFYGDKEPDIDLNFSGDYQPRAHAYTEEIFGEGHTFRAGTIGTLAEKTAYGYVLKYLEETGHAPMRKCEIERLAMGCTGVKRTTGQHPGGIVVLPHGEEIYSFTPIQHPANDMTTNIVTTHFEYHSIDHNLLKLDILGHDDPTMIRMLQDLIGMDPRTIPLDAPEVMRLFQSTEPLGIRPEDIGGTRFGTLGIPEFGTDFAMGILEGAKPRYFSDLVRISGLSHGTDVWQGNAEVLLQEGTTTIQEAICCRDDIMIYLIQKGMEPGEAFNIMENVRKGKFTKDPGKMQKWIDHMKEADVPDWYIGSCRKIKYMFPKAHAAAYVMMAWRIAWCKIHEPLAYYAAYFTIRAKAFDYVKMCAGREALERHLEAYKRNSDILSEKEKDELRDMRSVQEMYARGLEFMPIDLYRADATKFQIIDGKLMPPFTSIEGMGETAARSLQAAAKDGKFLSREDMVRRGHIPQTMADTMAELGLLGGMPVSDQISLFDLM